MRKQAIVCNAPWGCTNLCRQNNEDKRSVEGIEVCHSCYNYVWKHCRKNNKNGLMSFVGLEGPSRYPKRIVCTCSRFGCSRKLRPKMGQRYRFISKYPVCDSCYQAIWRRAKRRKIGLITAFHEMPIKNKKLSRTITRALRKTG